MVHNRNNRALRISEIGLVPSATSSYFRVNVDGATNPDNHFRNIEIGARDSMHIFIAVNVAELGQDAPLFIQDRLFFNTNGVMQHIVLETYGQDVEIFHGKTILNDTTLTANRPYIIRDTLRIAEGATLTLEAGTRLFFHNNAALFVFGNLVAEGTAEQPIVMRGNRFDNINFARPVPYNLVAGQWNGLYLLGNGTHRMHHVNINSADVGIYLSANTLSPIPAPSEMPTLELSNSRIHNFLFHGLFAHNANVTVANSVISNSASYTVLLNGGEHIFVHTTIANYFNSGVSAVQARNRNSSHPAVMIMNMDRSLPMKTVFLNSAIAGSVSNEFTLATRFPHEYNGVFRNSYIKRNPLELPQFQDIRWYERGDTIFKSTAMNINNNQYYNFEPDSVSPLLHLADPNVMDLPEFARFNLRFDLNGNDRTESEIPAAGAFEFRVDDEE